MVEQANNELEIEGKNLDRLSLIKASIEELKLFDQRILKSEELWNHLI
jgi:hypothetical protein